MKKSFFSLLLLAAFSLGSLCAYGAEATAQAIVLSVKGNATISYEGHSGQSSVLTVGEKLPQGATIMTGPDSEVQIQAFNGAVATIKADTTIGLEKLSVTTSGGKVTKQTALLNLTKGAVFSSIDPSNHNINDYGIRTPKGVAAARGTEYLVSLTTDGDVVIYVSDSAVTFTNPVTHQTITVEKGHQIIIDHVTGLMTETAVTTAAKNGTKQTTTKTQNETTDDAGNPTVDITTIPVSQDK